MTRNEFESLVLEAYGTKADYPFDEDFETGIFRHQSSKKWFAIAMKIPRNKIGFLDDKIIDVVNFKCAPEIIESLAGIESGIFRAYHMNKIHWLTVALDMCDSDTVAWLLEISYNLTKPKEKRKNKRTQ